MERRLRPCGLEARRVAALAVALAACLFAISCGGGGGSGGGSGPAESSLSFDSSAPAGGGRGETMSFPFQFVRGTSDSQPRTLSLSTTGSLVVQNVVVTPGSISASARNLSGTVRFEPVSGTGLLRLEASSPSDDAVVATRSFIAASRAVDGSIGPNQIPIVLNRSQTIGMVFTPRGNCAAGAVTIPLDVPAGATIEPSTLSLTFAEGQVDPIATNVQLRVSNPALIGSVLVFRIRDTANASVCVRGDSVQLPVGPGGPPFETELSFVPTDVTLVPGGNSVSVRATIRVLGDWEGTVTVEFRNMESTHGIYLIPEGFAMLIFPDRYRVAMPLVFDAQTRQVSLRYHFFYIPVGSNAPPFSHWMRVINDGNTTEVATSNISLHP